LTRTADVEQYVERNFPELYPDTKNRFKAYINSLLGSEDVVSLLDSIGAYTDPNLESELAVSGGESSFFMHRELHPLAYKYQDLRYQAVIAYSRYFKDQTLFEMIADWFLGGDAVVSYGGVASWPVVQTMDEPGNKAFDQGYSMDMYVQGLPVLVFRLFYSLDRRVLGDSFDDLVAGINKVLDLLVLVTPARIPVLFHTIPVFYVGCAPYKFESDIVSGNLYVEGEGVASNPDRPFHLESRGEEVYLAYDGDLEFELEDGKVFTKSGVFSGGMSVALSPFEDPDQLNIVAGLDTGKLGSGDNGYYFVVESNVFSQYYSVSRKGRKLIVLLEGPAPVTSLRIFSNYAGLNDIELEFDPALMPRYISDSFPLYSVQVLIDFG
jgi:hypothetical protein